MQFINPTKAQLLRDIGAKSFSRAKLESELKGVEEILLSGEIKLLESENRFDIRNINASLVNIDGTTFRDFSMVTNMIFTNKDYTFFSNGIYAFSIRLIMENYKSVMEELLARFDSAVVD